MSTTETTPCTPCARPGSDSERATRPVYDSREQDGEVLVQVALPGVRKEDTTVTTDKQVLSLSATRSTGIPDGATPHQTVKRPSHYELRLRLDASLDPAQVSATLENGVLSLRIPRRPEASPREIAVN